MESESDASDEQLVFHHVVRSDRLVSRETCRLSKPFLNGLV